MGALSAMVNSEIKRTIDLRNSVVRETASITVVGHKGESTYEVVVREELVENLAWLSVSNVFSSDNSRVREERKWMRKGMMTWCELWWDYCVSHTGLYESRSTL